MNGDSNNRNLSITRWPYICSVKLTFFSAVASAYGISGYNTNVYNQARVCDFSLKRTWPKMAPCHDKGPRSWQMVILPLWALAQTLKGTLYMFYGSNDWLDSWWHMQILSKWPRRSCDMCWADAWIFGVLKIERKRSDDPEILGISRAQGRRPVVPLLQTLGRSLSGLLARRSQRESRAKNRHDGDS